VIATSLLLTQCHAANEGDHVVRVNGSHSIPYFPLLVTNLHGNGICLNGECSVIVTCYHIRAMAGGGHLSITNAVTKRELLATQNESNETYVRVGGGHKTLRYDVASDLLFIQTTKSVHAKSGVLLSYKAHIGQKVIVVGYDNSGIKTTEAHIVALNAQLAVGPASLTENILLDTSFKPGSSGSAVLDENGNLLGMLCASLTSPEPRLMSSRSLALPTRTIAEAFLKLDPTLASTIFYDIPKAEAATLQPTVQADPAIDAPDDPSPVIPDFSVTRTDVPGAVDMLHTKARDRSQSTINFIAKQCLVQGTRGPICHELSMVDGEKVFNVSRRTVRSAAVKRLFPCNLMALGSGTTGPKRWKVLRTAHGPLKDQSETIICSQTYLQPRMMSVTT
jgi:hypothetical protein